MIKQKGTDIKSVPILLAALLLTSCAPATNQPEPTPHPGSEQVEMDTSSHSADNTASDVSWERYQPPITPASLELDFPLGDGEYRTFPALTKEEREAFTQSEDYLDQFFHRLEENGIRLTVDDSATFFSEAHVDNPDYYALTCTVFHHKAFDIFSINYPGYRADNSGDLYVFENGAYKGCIKSFGDLDFSDCIRELGDNVWFVTNWNGGGTGMSTRSKEWRNLNKDQFPEELYYMERYNSTSLSFYMDLGLVIDFHYSAGEEELFLNDQGIPTLRIHWEKTIDCENGIVTVTSSGTEEYPIAAPVEYEIFEAKNNAYFLGLEDQYRAYIETGTEEQRHIARQMLDYFSQD